MWGLLGQLTDILWPMSDLQPVQQMRPRTHEAVLPRVRRALAEMAASAATTIPTPSRTPAHATASTAHMMALLLEAVRTAQHCEALCSIAACRYC